MDPFCYTRYASAGSKATEVSLTMARPILSLTRIIKFHAMTFATALGQQRSKENSRQSPYYVPPQYSFPLHSIISDMYLAKIVCQMPPDNPIRTNGDVPDPKGEATLLGRSYIAVQLYRN